MSKLGDNIRELRKERGLSQEDFAKELFVTRQTLLSYENGNDFPTSILERIADYFNVSTDFLLGKTNSREIKDESIMKISNSTGLSDKAIHALKDSMARFKEKPYTIDFNFPHILINLLFDKGHENIFGFLLDFLRINITDPLYRDMYVPTIWKNSDEFSQEEFLISYVLRIYKSLKPLRDKLEKDKFFDAEQLREELNRLVNPEAYKTKEERGEEHEAIRKSCEEDPD